MRVTKLYAPVLIMMLALFPALPVFGADGATIFKGKCAPCHGPEGQGKIGPSLKRVSLSAEQITEMLTKGNEAKKPPHKKPMPNITPEDAKSVAEFVKTLK